jgi:hypothetical protein
VAQPEGEVELWWGGYSGWTMLPEFAVCAFLTAGMIGAAFYLHEEENLPGNVARYAVYILTLALWCMVLFRWGWRMATLNYRLTTRRLFRCRGLGVNRVDAVPLTEISRVWAEQTTMERRLGVGRVLVEHDESGRVSAGSAPSADGSPLQLTGVREPHRIAALIERQIKQPTNDAVS